MLAAFYPRPLQIGNHVPDLKKLFTSFESTASPNEVVSG